MGSAAQASKMKKEINQNITHLESLKTQSLSFSVSESLEIATHSLETLREENQKLKTTVRKHTLNYFQEIQSIRDSVYLKNQLQSSTDIHKHVRFFDGTEILDEEIKDLVNTRLSEMGDVYNERLGHLQHTCELYKTQLTIFQ